MTVFLWSAYEVDGNLYVGNPSKGEFMVTLGDRRLARALAHILNSTPTHKIERSDEEMDSRGVARVKL